MGRQPKIGHYRHQPGPVMRRGPDGQLRPTRVRRRFPYGGLVFLVSGLMGTLTCAGASQLLLTVGGRSLLPARVADQALPPAPGIENVLFGAGAQETALACAIAGWWLWRVLWNTALPEGPEGGRGAFGTLLTQGLILGPAFAFLALLVGMAGLYIRTAPARQPWPVRVLLSPLAAIPVTFSALSTGVIPLVVLGLGLLLGLVTALAVSLFWKQIPAEPAPGG